MLASEARRVGEDGGVRVLRWRGEHEEIDVLSRGLL